MSRHYNIQAVSMNTLLTRSCQYYRLSLHSVSLNLLHKNAEQTMPVLLHSQSYMHGYRCSQAVPYPDFRSPAAAQILYIHLSE